MVYKWDNYVRDTQSILQVIIQIELTQMHSSHAAANVHSTKPGSSRQIPHLSHEKKKKLITFHEILVG